MSSYREAGSIDPDLIKYLENSEEKIQWPKTGKKLTDKEYKEFRDKANTLGFKVSEMKDFDGDPDLIIECLEKTKAVRDKFPDLFTGKKQPIISKAFIGPFVTEDDFAITVGHTISINNSAYRSREILAKEYKKLADAGWFVKGTDYKSVIIHELGHVFCERYHIKPLEIAMKVTGRGPKETMKYLELNLSRYSSEFDDGIEIISEVFSDYFNNENPSEFSLKFIEELDKMILKERS